MNGQITSLKATSDVDSQSTALGRQSLPNGGGLFALLMADNGNVQSTTAPQEGMPVLPETVLTGDNASAKALADVLPQLSLKETPLSVTGKGVEASDVQASLTEVSEDEAQFLTSFGRFRAADMRSDVSKVASETSAKALAQQKLADTDAGELDVDLPSDMASLASVQNAVKQVALAQGEKAALAKGSAAEISVDMVQADMAQTDAVKADMPQAEMTQANAGQPDMTTADMAQVDADQVDLAQATIPKTNATQADRVQTTSKTDAAQADVAQTATSKTGAAQTDRVGTDAPQADMLQVDASQVDDVSSGNASHDSINPVVEPVDDSMPDGADADVAMNAAAGQTAHSDDPQHTDNEKKTLDGAQQSAQSVQASTASNSSSNAASSSSASTSSSSGQSQSTAQSSMSGQQGGQQNSQQGASQNPQFSYNAAPNQNPQTQQKQFERQSAAVKSFNDMVMADSNTADKVQKVLGDLGLGLSGKSQLPTSFQGIPFPVRSQQWGQALGQRVVYMASNKIQEAKITLNPEKLGPVQIKLHMDKDKQIHVAMSAHHATTKESMEAAIPKLRDMLGEAGIDFGDIDVSQDNSQFQGEETNDQPGQGNASNGGTTLASDEEQASQPVVIKTSDNLVDYYA